MAKEVEIKLKLTELGGEAVKNLIAEITNVDEVTRALTNSVKDANGRLKQAADTGFRFAQIRDIIKGAAEAFETFTRPATDFEQAMRATNTMAGKGEAEFGKLKNSVAELAKEIPLARDLLAKGLYQVISNAVPEDNWLTFLEKSSRAAVGGLADLEKVVTVTATVIKNYGLSWEEAGNIQDKIQLVAQLGVTSFEQLADALPKVTGAAAILGVDLNELMAVFATLTGVSGNTAEVSTQLSAALMALISPTSEAAKMAQAMGIQFDALAVKAAGGLVPFLKNLTVEIDKFAKKTGMSSVEIESSLFSSSRSLKALIPLTGELAGKFESNFSEMVNSAGTIDFAFEQMNSTAQFLFATLCLRLQALRTVLPPPADFADFSAL
jgi:TP901 family phage tail tape measure protein